MKSMAQKRKTPDHAKVRRGLARKCVSPVFTVWDQGRRCYMLASTRNAALVPGTDRTFSTWVTAGGAASAIIAEYRRKARRGESEAIRRVEDQHNYEVHEMRLTYVRKV